MSKLTLNFYLSLLSNTDNITDFEAVEHNAILFDDISGASLEGGGRILVAMNGTSFEVPEDADKGLVYVGLDENFNSLGFMCK